jgi:hypothetical protein
MSFSVKPQAPKEGEVLPEIVNNEDVEKSWAISAVKHSETYMKLITSFPDHSKLKLTP